MITIWTKHELKVCICVLVVALVQSSAHAEGPWFMNGKDKKGQPVSIVWDNGEYHVLMANQRFSATIEREKDGLQFRDTIRNGLEHGVFTCKFADGTMHYQGYSKFGLRHGHCFGV